jgi:hypothetical protein
MKSKKQTSEKVLVKQESRTMLEKEFEKANYIINLKVKELTTEKYEKAVENSKLKGEEKVLEVRTRHLALELEDKEKENHGLQAEIRKLEDEIQDYERQAADNLSIVKEKRKLLAEFKKNKGFEFSNKKNDCANTNEKSKDEILNQKMKINSLIFSNQMKKEDCSRLKKQLEEIEKQYQQALNYEAQGVKKATTIFKEMRDNY